MLEIGFASRATRLKYASLAHEAGLSVQLHVLDVPAEERWRRVQMRNDQTTAHGQLSFAVTREMFDFTETFWDPPTAEEMAAGNGIRVTS